MAGKKAKLGEILIEWGLINQEDLEKALGVQNTAISALPENCEREPVPVDYSSLLDNKSNASLMLSVSEVSRLLHVHVNTVRRWSDNETLKSYRINGRGDRRFHKDEIARLMSEHNNFSQKKSS